MEKELLELKKLVVSGDASDNNKQYEELFLELMNQGLTVKSDKDRGTVTYSNSEGKFIVHQELKTKRIYLSYWRIWKVFESKFGLNYEETKSLLTSMVETHLDLKGYTPFVRGGMIENG